MAGSRASLPGLMSRREGEQGTLSKGGDGERQEMRGEPEEKREHTHRLRERSQCGERRHKDSGEGDHRRTWVPEEV